MTTRQRWGERDDRDDRGGVPVSFAVAALGVCLTIGFVAVAAAARGSLLTRAGHGLIATCGLAGFLVVLFGALEISQWWVRRSDQRLTHQLGPLLSGWLGATRTRR